MRDRVVVVGIGIGIAVGLTAATAAGAFGSSPATPASAFAPPAAARGGAQGRGAVGSSGGSTSPASTTALSPSSGPAPPRARSTTKSTAVSGSRPATSSRSRPIHLTMPPRKSSRSAGQLPSSTSAIRTPLLIAGTYAGRDPRQIDFSVDEGNIVTNLAWTSWSSSGAVGQGRSDADTCVPNCAVAPVDLEATTVTLSAPIDGHFSVITEERGGRAERFTYPEVWPVGAARSTRTPTSTPASISTAEPSSTRGPSSTSGPSSSSSTSLANGTGAAVSSAAVRSPAGSTTP